MNTLILPLQNTGNIETVGVFHGFISWIITLIIVLVTSLLIWKTLIPFLKSCLTALIDRDERNIKLILSTFETAINKVVEQLSKDIQEVRSEIKDLKRGSN